MTSKDRIQHFISANDPDQLQNYYDKLFEKKKEVDKRINQISIYCILTVLAFFILPPVVPSSIEFGPIAISDSSVIFSLIPLLFCFFFFEFAIQTNCKGDLVQAINLMNLHLYKQKPDIDKSGKEVINYFSALLSPLSLWEEMQRFFSTTNGLGCWGACLILPGMSLLFLPFIFQVVSIHYIIEHHWSSMIGKFSTIISIWLALTTLYTFIQIMRGNYKQIEAESSKT